MEGACSVVLMLSDVLCSIHTQSHAQTSFSIGLFFSVKCILNDANYGPLAENVKQYLPALAAD